MEKHGNCGCVRTRCLLKAKPGEKKSHKVEDQSQADKWCWQSLFPITYTVSNRTEELSIISRRMYFSKREKSVKVFSSAHFLIFCSSKNEIVLASTNLVIIFFSKTLFLSMVLRITLELQTSDYLDIFKYNFFLFLYT